MYDFAHDADPQAAGYGAPPLLLTAAEAFPRDAASTASRGRCWCSPGSWPTTR